MIQKPKGTKDILPEELCKWKYIEFIAAKTFEDYAFKEIRIPTFEYTELFERGVGDTTDVVQKEMYTFEDKGGRSITLRPEGTAGIVRSFIENGISSKPLPFKVHYAMPMFRYENVQKGRYREFNQIGAEIIGTPSYLADVELISMADKFLKDLDLKDVYLTINSIGCPECRKKYQEALKEFIGKNINSYCSTCKSRFDKNPMRILDCKEKQCKELNQGAPVILDYLCEECKTHFENVKRALNELGIKYEIDTSIVRGLDYYTKTVFEFISKVDGYTVLAGGRYDGLVKELGGQDMPAVGFAAGEERLLSLFSTDEDLDLSTQLYIVSMGEKYDVEAMKLANELREVFCVQTNISSRSFNAQMKYANKINTEYLIVLGEDEVKNKKCKLKEMETGKEVEIELNFESIFDAISGFYTEEEEIDF